MGFRERKFGVELEFYGPEVLCKKYGFDSVVDEYGCGIIKWNLIQNLGISFAGGHKRNGWTMENEFLNGSFKRGQFEISSPILKGVKDMRTLKNVAASLQNLDCITDTSCGLHVHVDVSDLTTYEIAAVVARYAELEDKIDSFVDKSRQGNRNRFCKSPKRFLPAVVWEAVKASDSKHKITKTTWANKIWYDRQTKVNIESVSQFGTLEFRHHHGTLDPDRIEAWVKFCINFIEQTRKELKGFRYPRKRLPPLKQEVPCWIIANKLNRYPNDYSWAFKPWSQSPLKGLNPKVRKILQAS